MACCGRAEPWHAVAELSELSHGAVAELSHENTQATLPLNVSLKTVTLTLYWKYNQGLWSLIYKDLREDSVFRLISTGSAKPTYVMRTLKWGGCIQYAFGRDDTRIRGSMGLSFEVFK